MKTYNASLLNLIVLFALSALSFGMVMAQETTPDASSTQETMLRFGVPVEGEITNGDFTQEWTLQVASADRVAIRVERTDGNLIPDVRVLNGSDTEIANSYGADETNAAAVINEVTLPNAGEYQVIVSRENAETGVTEGTYTIEVTPLATGADNPNNASIVGEVAYNTVIEGEITATHWLQRYTLNAQAPDTLGIEVERLDGTLMPEIEVLDSNGSVLQTGYLDAERDSAFVEINLPSAGEYQIIVTRQQRFEGDSTGGYQLIVELLGAGEGSPFLAEPAGTVEYDTLIAGEITHAQWYRDYTLQTNTGDTITITAQRPLDLTSDEAGNLQPEVVLLGGSGQELRRGYTDSSGDMIGAQAVINRYTLENPGTYTVRVTRANNQSGDTTGLFNLTVSLTGTGAANPALNESVGTIEVGASIDGEITNAQWRQAWAFDAQADQALDIEVERTAGTFSPIIEIVDSNGQAVRTAYTEVTGDRALLTRYVFPSAGQYRIVVSRYNGQSDPTTGEYSLSVSPAAS